MDRIKVALDYSEQYLEIERPQPLSDRFIEQLIVDVSSGKLDKDISDSVYSNFIEECDNWIHSTKLNKLTGLDKFNRKDIMNGCTQFIDNIYMQGPVQVLEGDYRYHNRLNRCKFTTVGNLDDTMPLIISVPFPRYGAQHEQMTEILDECLKKDISVHIDGAWITCCKDLSFDFSHPSIKSVGISLSKGLGLGWNRIGLRWTKDPEPDSITIMNDFKMNNRALTMIGLYFIRHIQNDYLWNTYGETYNKICKDFNLTPTKSIHLAMRNNSPVGLSPLIRYVTQQ